MSNQIEQADRMHETSDTSGGLYDYTHVDSTARIALYDDLRSAPRVTEITPAATTEYIENLSVKVYEQAKASGGTIPYTVIREVSENFIHAQFTEVTVSILDKGNTIRFADQGPGISQKEKAQLPGFTSAIEPMKHYIRGVGSGLPIVKEYLDFSQGTITIEDNLKTGSVVTISLQPEQEKEQFPVTEHPSSPQLMQGGTPHYPYPNEAVYPSQQYRTLDYTSAMPQGYYHQQPVGGMPVMQQPAYTHPMESLIPPLTQRERDFLPIFLNEGALGVTDLVKLTGVPQSSTYVTLTKLEQAGLIEKTVGQKRILTDMGYQVSISL